MRFGHRNLASVLVVSVAIFGVASGQVSAQPSDPPHPLIEVNQRTEVHPNLGTVQPGLIPGVDGYKVFHPGAIVRVGVRSIATTATGSIRPNTFYRRGNTDAFLAGLGTVEANHSSDSDLLEDTIRVDGTLQLSGQPILNSCADPKYTSHSALCSTTTGAGASSGTYVAKSYHFFHKSGYTDTNLNTQDNQVK